MTEPEIQVEVEPTWDEAVDFLTKYQSRRKLDKLISRLEQWTCDCRECGDPAHGKVHKIIERVRQNYPRNMYY